MEEILTIASSLQQRISQQEIFFKVSKLLIIIDILFLEVTKSLKVSKSI